MNHKPNTDTATFVINVRMTFSMSYRFSGHLKSDDAMRNNLLLILHNKQQRLSLSKSLQPFYNVFEAESRDTADQICKVISVQVIICWADNARPDGWDLCVQLKSSPAYYHIPVILMGGDDSLHAKIKSLEAGADAFIDTNADLRYLKTLINNLIENRTKFAAHVTKLRLAAEQHIDLIRDDDFIEKLNDQIACHLPDNALCVDLLARLMNMSRPTLYRKIKTITDLTPNELINEARLKRAAQLLATGHYKVFQIAKMVGFQTQSSFGKAFIKQFKLTPTQYLKQREGEHKYLSHMYTV